MDDSVLGIYSVKLRDWTMEYGSRIGKTCQKKLPSKNLTLEMLDMSVDIQD